MPIVKSGEGRQVTIPKEVWNSLKLQSRELFEIVEENGCIVLVPKKDLDEDQRAFWSEECQKGITKGLKEIEEGKSKRFDNVEDLIKDLSS